MEGVDKTESALPRPRRAAFAALILATVASACGGGTPVAEANSSCADVSVSAPPVGAPHPDIVPTVTVFLIDRAYAPSSGRGPSYGPGELPAQAQKDLRKLLADPRFAVRGGDVQFASRISSKSNATGEVFVEADKAPVIPPPVFDEIVSAPQLPVSDLGCTAYAVQVRDYNAWVRDETARRNAAIARWKSAEVVSNGAFRDRIAAQVGAATFALDRAGTDIAGAVDVASDIFKQYRAAGARLRLLIWSDLTETVERPLHADLRGVTVVIARYRRDDIDDQAGGQKEWEPRLRERGAARVTFLRWSATSGDTILAGLGQ